MKGNQTMCKVERITKEQKETRLASYYFSVSEHARKNGKSIKSWFYRRKAEKIFAKNGVTLIAI